MAAGKKKTAKKKAARKKAPAKRAPRKKRATKKKATKPKKAGAPKGNQFWKKREYHGRNMIFETPIQLWEAAKKYFEWVEATPLTEEKMFSYQGDTVTGEVSKMRPMTIRGLCHYINIHHSTWIDYRSREDFSDICAHIEDIIYDQKFTGAAADLLNASIIARDLGLKDKKELSTPDGKPLISFYLPENGR